MTPRGGRPGRDPWLGPLFRHELVRAARAGRPNRGRVAFCGLLLAGLLAAYLREFGTRGLFAAGADAGLVLSLDATARFARAFLTVFLFAQAAAVVVITPAVVGGAVAAEKERGTYDLLRASALTAREIALGKLAAGLLAVGGVLLAGLPVLALTMLFGGVDVAVLLAGYAVCGLTAVSLGGYSLYLGVTRPGLGDVLSGAYAAAAGLTLVGLCLGWCPGLAALSPFSVLAYLLFGQGPTDPTFVVNVAAFAGLHGPVGVAFAWRAVAAVRRPAREQWPDRSPDPTEAPTRPRPAARHRYVPRLWNQDPLLWREQHFAGRGGAGGGAGRGCLLSMAGVFVVWFVGAALSVALDGTDPGRNLGPTVRVGVVVGTVGAALVAGSRAAGAVARERQRQTLDTLFALPVDRADVLRAKLRTTVRGVRPWLVGAGLVAAVGALGGAVHPVGAVAAAALAAGAVGFAVALGLWLSVRTDTVPRATTRFLLALLACWFGPLLPAAVEPSGLLAAVSPPVGVWAAMFARGEFPGRFPWAVAALAAGAGYAAAAWVLWRAAVRRFDREGK